MIKLIKIVIFCTLLAGTNNLIAQTLIHPKVAIVGLHPFDSRNKPTLHENKIDANGNWVVEPNIMVSIESYIRDVKFSWRFMPGFYTDALSQPAMFFHAGLKLRVFQIWRSSVDIAAGPSYNFRKSYQKIPNYLKEGPYNENGEWENHFGLLAEIEYKYYISSKLDFTTSIMYGHEWNTFTLTAGLRFWLSTYIKHPSKCGGCPFDK